MNQPWYFRKKEIYYKGFVLVFCYSKSAPWFIQPMGQGHFLFFLVIELHSTKRIVLVLDGRFSHMWREISISCVFLMDRKPGEWLYEVYATKCTETLS